MSKKKNQSVRRVSPKGAGYVPPMGREVLPMEMADGSQFDPDAYLDWVEAQGNVGAKAWAYDVRRQKRDGQRPLPSANLSSFGEHPPPDVRASLLDMIATLVDEHVFGRSDMCLQFAALLERALNAMGVGAEARAGRAEYNRTSGAKMTWDHAWVVLDDGAVVDGNADSIRENRVIGRDVVVNSYWGPTENMPDDRRLLDGARLSDEHRNDPDVARWWPRLERWMQKKELVAAAPAPKS